jgi:uncharacterized protein (DUF1684 family)
MNKSFGCFVAAILVISIVACGPAEPKLDLAAYEAEIMEWRGGRLERLLAPNGYLTQIGLHWLDEQVYTIGSDPGSDIVVPATAAARIGELRVAPDGVWLVVEEGVEVLQDGEPVSEVLMAADTSENPVMVTDCRSNSGLRASIRRHLRAASLLRYRSCISCDSGIEKI